MRIRLASLLTLIVALAVLSHGPDKIARVAVTDPAVIASSVPAPLYRDPVFDGAADPVLVWNPGQSAWWMFYTQRRAKIDVPGVAWCHGTEIGVAESRDVGMTWYYRRNASALATRTPDYSFWAPDVIRDEAGPVPYVS